MSRTLLLVLFLAIGLEMAVGARKKKMKQLLEDVQAMREQLAQMAASNIDCQITAVSYTWQQCRTGHVDLNRKRLWEGCPRGVSHQFQLFRGVTTMIIEPFSCTTSEVRRFDTCGRTEDSEDLATYLSSVPDGKLVLGVTADDANSRLTPALATLAANGVAVGDVQIRGTFAFLLHKGFVDKTLMNKTVSGSGSPASLAVRLHGSSLNDMEIVNLNN